MCPLGSPTFRHVSCASTHARAERESIVPGIPHGRAVGTAAPRVRRRLYKTRVPGMQRRWDVHMSSPPGNSTPGAVAFRVAGLGGADIRRADSLAFSGRRAGRPGRAARSVQPHSDTVHAQTQPDRRYMASTMHFRYGDGLMLHLMLRYAKPRRIELGSGVSTLYMIQGFLGDGVQSRRLWIPTPERLHGLLRTGDARGIPTGGDQIVQDVDAGVFVALESGTCHSSIAAMSPRREATSTT